MDLLKQLGKNLRRLIQNKSGTGSIELFAHENQIPKSTLSEILNGKNDPKLTTLARICSGLEITLSELFVDPTIDSWVKESAATYNIHNNTRTSHRHRSIRKPSKEKDGPSRKK